MCFFLLWFCVCVCVFCYVLFFVVVFFLSCSCYVLFLCAILFTEWNTVDITEIKNKNSI